MKKKNVSVCGIFAAVTLAALLLTGCPPPPETDSKTVTGIAVTTPPAKIQYNRNEELDTKGMVVTATFSDGTTQAVTGYTTGGYDKTKTGSQTVTVTYQGKTASFTVNVIDPSKPTVDKPTANPGAGAVASNTSVTLSTTTDGAEIWYTVNGSAPAKNGAGSAKYTTAFAITPPVTVKAVAVKEGMNDSAVLEAAYTLSGSASGTPITSVSIAIPAPAKDGVPAATATTSGTVNFTVGTVTWSPADNPYQGGKVYTASVTLTAASGYTFTGLTTASVNTQTAIVSNNTGGSVTLSYAFPATDTRTVMALGIQFQPSKMSYNHNETLNLAGLIIQIIYDNSTNESVPLANFAAKNITASPANGDALSVAANNGKPVTIRHGSHTVDTGSLTVNPIAPVAADFTVNGQTQTYDGNPKTVTVTAKEGKTTGTVSNIKYGSSTTAPSDAGTYTITFDVTADTNYTSANGLSEGTLTITKATPTIDDFTVSGTGTSFTYNGSARTVTVTANDGITGMGTVTVKYNGITTAPIDGTYDVTFDVAEGTNYTEADGLSAGTLAITLPPFTTIAALSSWLSAKPANTSDTAYTAVLNVSSLGSSFDNGLGATLRSRSTKYVYLDLSGSTFTTIPAYTVDGYYQGAFQYCENLTGITLPNNLTSIGEQAFTSCTSLTAITIPNSVTSIRQSAFAYSGLASVTIPASVTSIGDYVFQHCASLTEINVDPANSFYSSADGVLYNKAKTTLVAYPVGKAVTTFTIPNSVTSIGNGAFTGCKSLTSVIMPNSVTSIGISAFGSCTSLASVNIPNSVTSIGEGAFRETSLTSITIPASVTKIERSAFYGCTSLTSVTFAEGSNISNTNFGSSAFPEGNYGGDTLKTAYSTGKAGTYTRPANGSTWTKQ